MVGRDRGREEGEGPGAAACTTDQIDAWVLAELSRRDLVPAIWLPGPKVRGARELARVRLHLFRHCTALKSRIHASLIAVVIARDLAEAIWHKLKENEPFEPAVVHAKTAA